MTMELRPLGFGLLAALVSVVVVGQLSPFEPRRALTVFEAPTPPIQPWPAVLVTNQELADWLAAGDAVAVDLRSREAFQQGHLPGARHLGPDLDELDLDLIRQALGNLGLTGRERVVLYGDGSDLPGLGRAFWLLERAGVERLAVLREGHDGWYLAGRELETRSEAVLPARFARPVRRDLRVSLDWLRAHYGLAGIEVLDVRDWDSWSQPDYEAPPRFAAGHVPMSSPAGIAAWVEQGLPTASDVWRRLLALGPRPASYLDLSGELVLYGEGEDDPWLGLGYLLLRAAGVEVKVFVDGWKSWEGCMDCPTMKIVGAAEVARLLAEAREGHLAAELAPVVVDLREQRAYDQAHVPGALLIPAYEIDQQFEPAVRHHRPGLERERVPLVLYCYGRSCVRSREAASFAGRHGFVDLWWLRDGLEGWPEGELAASVAAKPPAQRESP